MSDLLKAGAGRAAAVGGAIGSFMVMGFVLASTAAATPDPVGEAFTDLQGKVTVYGAATVALVVAAVVVFFGIKFLKRGASKA